VIERVLESYHTNHLPVPGEKLDESWNQIVHLTLGLKPSHSAPTNKRTGLRKNFMV